MAEDDVEMNRGYRESGSITRNIKRALPELEILRGKFKSIALTTIPAVIITACFMLLLQSVTNGSPMLKASQPLLILAIITSLATMFCGAVWGSELGTTSKKIERAIAVIEGRVSGERFPANPESRFENCVRDFYFRHLLLVFMRTTYLFLFILGCIFAGVGILRPPWFLLFVVLSASLIFAIIVVVHMYKDYVEYNTYLGPSAAEETPQLAPKGLEDTSRMAEEDVEMNGADKERAVMMANIERASEELETLLGKYKSMMLPNIPSVIITVCFMLLLQLVGGSDGEGYVLTRANAMLRGAQPFLVLAIIISLATWFCSLEWGSELDATTRKCRRALRAMIQGSASQLHQFPSITESRYEECARDYYFRYLLLVSMRTTYLFSFQLGSICAGVGMLRPPWHQYWLLLTVTLSSSLVFTLTVIFHIYRAYTGYRGCLTRLGFLPVREKKSILSSSPGN